MWSSILNSEATILTSKLRLKGHGDSRYVEGWIKAGVICPLHSEPHSTSRLLFSIYQTGYMYLMCFLEHKAKICEYDRVKVKLPLENRACELWMQDLFASFSK